MQNGFQRLTWLAAWSDGLLKGERLGNPSLTQCLLDVGGKYPDQWSHRAVNLHCNSSNSLSNGFPEANLTPTAYYAYSQCCQSQTFCHHQQHYFFSHYSIKQSQTQKVTNTFRGSYPKNNHVKFRLSRMRMNVCGRISNMSGRRMRNGEETERKQHFLHKTIIIETNTVLSSDVMNALQILIIMSNKNYLIATEKAR